MGEHARGGKHRSGRPQVPDKDICKQYGHDVELGSGYVDKEGRAVSDDFSGQKYVTWSCKRNCGSSGGLRRA
jgi:hypothetical protein